MSTIDELYADFAQLNLREKLPELVLQTSTEITGFIIEQKAKGELSTGEKITPSYKDPAYAKAKYWKYNPLPGYGTPDGRLTGAFDAGLSVTIRGDEYDVESNVPYAQDESLLQYGDNFIRLNDQNMTTYCEDTLAPVIQDYITAVTGLIFE
jgi:hypothetical protein